MVNRDSWQEILSHAVMYMPKAPKRIFCREQKASKYREGATTRSLLLPMRDGIKLAMDVVLPAALEEEDNLPCLMLMTRHWRSFSMWWPSSSRRAPLHLHHVPVDDYVAQGYAVVCVDARGSGASYGYWLHPWSSDEIEDYGEVVDWIVRQPWSNGRVGSLGLSYEGNTAELLASTDREAIQAIIPQMMFVDLYRDLICPGGLTNQHFLQEWGQTLKLLLHDRLPKDRLPWYKRWLVRSVRTVDGFSGRTYLAEAKAMHRKNPDTVAPLRRLVSRNDPFPNQPKVTLDRISPFANRGSLQSRNIPVFGWGSWYDGATADCVIRRLTSYRCPQRAVIGAWNHTMQFHSSPFAEAGSPSSTQQWMECLSFLDEHLKSDQPTEAKSVLYYYTVGEERWHSTETWPPQGSTKQTWYLRPNQSLLQHAPEQPEGEDEYIADLAASSGLFHRWSMRRDGPISPEFSGRRLTYESPPLPESLRVTGHPVVSLYLRSTAPDGAFFVTLEAVGSGKIFYLTDGQLRAIHRKVSGEMPSYTMHTPYHTFEREDVEPLVPGEPTLLTFGLHPLSALIPKGCRLRLSVACADKDTFAPIPHAEVPTIHVLRTLAHPSCLELPVLPNHCPCNYC